MACAAGILALVEESTFHSIKLAKLLERFEGFYEKAMWTYLQYQQIFNVATLFISADTLPGRYWFISKNLPKKEPACSSDDISNFADALSEYYRDTQGRGHRCTVETYLRGGRQHYFFAYPDDYADTYIGHDDGGVFVKRPQKRAFEVVFVFDPLTGTIDLHAQGDRGVRARLLYIFCTVILNENPPPEPAGDHPYELNPLLTRDFQFATDPEDGIVEVRVRKIRLSLGNGKRRILLEADPQGGSQDVYDMIEEYLNVISLSNSNVNVTHAEFQIRFAPRGKGQKQHISFNVSFPNTSNLKNLNDEYRQLAEKYLKRWGIERE